MNAQLKCNLRNKIKCSAVCILLATPLPAAAADFWWRGDINNDWTAVLPFSNFILNTNFATASDGLVDTLAVPGTGDVVRFATSNASNLNTFLGANVILTGLTTEPSLTGDVTLDNFIGNTLNFAFNSTGIVTNAPHTLNLNTKVTVNATTFAINTAHPSSVVNLNSAYVGLVQSLTKSGPGTLNLNNANTYAGFTAVTNGVLNATVATALPAGTTLTVGQSSTASTARVNTGGFAQVLSSLTLFARNASSPTAVDVGSGTLFLTGPLSLLDTSDAQGNAFGATLAASPGGTLNLFGAIRSFTIAGQNVGQAELVIDAVITNGGINLTANPSTTIGNAAGMVLNAPSPNTYTGSTTVNAGTLTVNSTTTLGPGQLTLRTTGNVDSRVILNNAAQDISALATGPIGNAIPTVVLNGTALSVNQSFNTTFAGVLTGTGSLNKAGVGVLTLARTNTYTGGTVITGGALSAGIPNVLPIGYPLTIGRSAEKATAVLATSGFSQSISSLTLYARNGSNQIALDVGAGTLTLGGDLTLLDTQDTPGDAFGAVIAAFPGGTLHLGGATRTFTLAGQNVGKSELTVNAVITGGGIIVNAQPSSTIFNPAGMVLNATSPNTYAGGTTVNAGYLTVNSATTLGSGPLTLNSTGNVESGVILNNAFQIVTSLATTSVGLATPSLQLGGTALIVNQSSNTTFGGAITGVGSLTKSGPGSLSLTTASSYTGPTTIVGGTVSATAANAIPANTFLTIGQPAPSSTARFNANGNNHSIFGLTLYARNLSQLVAVDLGAATLTLNGNLSLLDTLDAPGNAYGAFITASPGGQLDLGGGVRAFTLAGQNVSKNELTVQAVITNGGIVLTANPSQVNGTAAGMVFTADAPNTYAGGTTINAGSLFVNASTTLGPGPLTINTTGLVASSVTLNRPTQLLTSLATGLVGVATPTLTLNSTALTVDQPGFSLFAGTIEGAGSLTKAGPGTLILTGTNTHTGGTTVSGGRLHIGAAGPTGSLAGNITLENAATLQFNRSDDFTFPGAITGNGRLAVSLPSTATQTFTGNITLSLELQANGGGTVVLDTPTTVGGLQLSGPQTTGVLAAGGTNTLITTGLFFENPTNTLQTHDNDIVVNYTGPSPIATLIFYLLSGQLSGQINPDKEFNGLPTTLAISEAADLGLTDFNGLPIDDTTVLLKYSFVGDANLDGQIDALDYERVDLAIGNTGVKGTAQGDLNYDGNVDALDYEQIDLNIGNGVGSPLGAVLIPEPTLLAPLALLPLLSTRRRK